ncbi:MAG: hypothetical protein WCH57_12135 [Verrucomicrobiota bacterium]
MAFSLFKTSAPKHRERGNRFVGKIWLVVIFVVLTGMNYAASYIVPYIGKFAPFYQGALFIATIWNGVLLAAIWNQQGWARFVLAFFLLGFVAAQLVFFPDILLHYPNLSGEGLRIILLLSLTNILAAIFLIFSLDIRWLSRPNND